MWSYAYTEQTDEQKYRHPAGWQTLFLKIYVAKKVRDICMYGEIKGN